MSAFDLTVEWNVGCAGFVEAFFELLLLVFMSSPWSIDLRRASPLGARWDKTRSCRLIADYAPAACGCRKRYTSRFQCGSYLLELARARGQPELDQTRAPSDSTSRCAGSLLCDRQWQPSLSHSFIISAVTFGCDKPSNWNASQVLVAALSRRSRSRSIFSVNRWTLNERPSGNNA